MDRATRIRSLEMRELECFLVLAEELHFGRTGERLYVSQSRVSQLLRSLEGRIGARLVERTSRRVELTALGSRFLAQLRPAYGMLGTPWTRRGRRRGAWPGGCGWGFWAAPTTG